MNRTVSSEAISINGLHRSNKESRTRLLSLMKATSTRRVTASRISNLFNGRLPYVSSWNTRDTRSRFKGSDGSTRSKIFWYLAYEMSQRPCESMGNHDLHFIQSRRETFQIFEHLRHRGCFGEHREY